MAIARPARCLPQLKRDGRDRPSAAGVASVHRRGWLKEQNVHLSVRDRPVFDTARDDKKFACLHPNGMVWKLHPEAAFYHQEQLILRLVIMPDEGTLKLHELDVLAVQFANQPGLEMVSEKRELLRQVDFVHTRISGGGRGIRTPERVSPLTVFKTAGFNHSPIPPATMVPDEARPRRFHSDGP